MFDEFFNDVFLAKLKHPMYTKRKFYCWDSLEPSVVKILDVNFYW